jgi:hypothetical protein
VPYRQYRDATDGVVAGFRQPGAIEDDDYYCAYSDTFGIDITAKQG